MRNYIAAVGCAIFLLFWSQSGHAAIPTGEGIKVAIIDSGIDPSHPDFIHKKLHGYDFITKKKKYIDPYGHGTHVAGIIQQIAPEVTFYIYRVLNEEGEGSSENVAHAIREAISKKVDVINLSLGKEIADGELAELIHRATQKGIVVVTGAGNSGPRGNTISSPANLTDAITVGSCTKDERVPIIQLEREEKQIELIPLGDSPLFPLEGDFSIMDVGKGKKRTDYKGASGKIVLAKRSHLYPRQISQIAHKHGAVALIVYNTHHGEWRGENGIRLDDCAIPTATVAGKYGTDLIETLKGGQSTVHFSSMDKGIVPYFSSRGPVLETGELKPDLVAPGVEIRSSFPCSVESTGYKTISGTSQAAAYVTGCVCLLKQKYPYWGPQEIKAALMGTAKPLTNTLHKMVSCVDQGAGEISMENSLATQSLAIPSSLSFGTVKVPSESITLEKTFTLKNQSNRVKQYSLRGECTFHSHGVKIRVPSVVEVSPKSETSIPITLQIDTTRQKEGRYTGIVWITESEESIHVPWLLVVKR